MSIRDRAGRIAIAIAMNSIVAAAANATAVTPLVRIKALQAGYVVDRMLVFPNPPTLTNDGCTLLTNGYILNENDPGHRTFYALLLAALLGGREVQLVISGCFEQRPRIVSVSIF